MKNYKHSSPDGGRCSHDSRGNKGGSAGCNAGRKILNEFFLDSIFSCLWCRSSGICTHLHPGPTWWGWGNVIGTRTTESLHGQSKLSVATSSQRCWRHTVFVLSSKSVVWEFRNNIFYNVDLLIPEGCEQAGSDITHALRATTAIQRVPLFMALWYFMANGSLANVFSVQRSWPHPVRHRSETLNQQWDRCDLCKTGTMQMVYVALVMVRYFTGVVSGLAVSKCVQTWHRSHDVTREGNKSMTIIPWRSCCFNGHGG